MRKTRVRAIKKTLTFVSGRTGTAVAPTKSEMRFGKKKYLALRSGRDYTPRPTASKPKPWRMQWPAPTEKSSGRAGGGGGRGIFGGFRRR